MIGSETFWDRQAARYAKSPVSDEAAYLFGLAVEQPRRNEGLGWVLADSVLRRARTLGSHAVYLLTRNSANFFAKRLGFRYSSL